jgi:class II aldolase/adducin N-terminal domain-containing protein
MQPTPIPGSRIVHIVGGGTISHVRNHLALCAPAYGTTARRIAELIGVFWTSVEVDLHLTKMADPASSIVTIDDLREVATEIVRDYRSKVVFWTPTIADFEGTVGDEASGSHVARLSSAEAVTMNLTPAPKLVTMFRRDAVGDRQPRKDIFLVAFKTTCGATEQEQYSAGLNLCKQASANLVLVNDVVTRLNMVVTPEESAYHVTTNRDEALRGLMEMTYLRSQLTFTRSTVVAGDPVPWGSERVPETLRTVVNYCIEHGAYKPFLGVTAGHFAVKVGEREFLTSRRKTNFNHLDSVGLVLVETDGPDSVIAHGSRPSVGGQSQRIVFDEHPDYDCIVHFHCPMLPDSKVPTVSQREYECGSHECGRNTSGGLAEFGNLSCVFLENHGPNIVFHDSIDPEEVIRFIEANFDLHAKTGGYVPSDVPVAA